MTKNLTKNLIIFKAYGGEPVKLYAIRSYGDIVEVAKVLGTEILPVRRNFISKFDEKLFDELCMAYNQNDQLRLNSLWSQTQPYEPESKG